MGRARQRLRAVTAPAAPAVVRAAVYTRKSTANGLDREFTSLHNQRERAEAYIDSQLDQGWTLVPTAYDDGGFSGGNIERPALRRLLGDVEAGQVDAIAVYRLDRLSRSLVDFVKVHEFLEKHGVALVSVTESINTSTPHGRMMVNVLLSFAQYERELIAERTSHKIQAARRKGKWTGGMPPLGYDVAPKGGKLTINKEEAATVRQVFELYADHPSLVEVAQEANRRGLRRKSWTTKDGKRREGKPWDRKTLSNFLRDPAYVGKVRLGDEVFPGEHRGIVPKVLFEKVQRLLDRNHRDRGATARNKYGALLRGLMRCSACDAAMTFAAAKNGGKAYRYYRCQSAQRNGHATCPAPSIPADKIEQFVVDEIRHIGADPALQDETFRQAVAQVKAQRRGRKHELRRLKTNLSTSRADVQRLVETVSRLTGLAADATASELATAQERVASLEARQAEIKNELTTLDTQAIDRDDLARALESFDPIWDVLLTPEKERVLRLLIERVDYEGGTGKLQISWRLAGFGQLAEEVGS
jgi:site-specific DNA recombinase